MTKPRGHDQLRPTSIEPYPPRPSSPGSVLISMGDTRVLCTASIDDQLPAWMLDKSGKPSSRGWVTAEYAMLPGATSHRKKRGPDGRATEIQRLIARVLRAAVDLEKMPGLAITCDCDVLVADGGTRTAAINGAFVALAQAFQHARSKGILKTNPLKGHVAAVSVGIIDGRSHLDLDYLLDSRAQVDMNIAMNHKKEFIEVQGTAENGAAFSRVQLNELLALAAGGIKKIIAIQKAALARL